MRAFAGCPPRWLRAAALGLAIFLCAAAACAQAQPRTPGAAWDELSPAQSGWSAQGLARAQALSAALGSSAVVIVQHGAIVGAWGETSTDMVLNSTRKSLLSALIGIAVQNGQINPGATLAQLNIDDNPPALTPAEKQATVLDLLEARSGVYHPANYETRGMAAERPPRGSHAPGTFWYYNNWDFNALGAIYEHATGTPVFTAFAREIAAPLRMQDFDPAKCRYVGGPDSIYPAYVFHASARDLARFGLLYLRHGLWGGRQIVPAAWIDRSVTSYSDATRGFGYGYLWWIVPPDLGASFVPPPGSFFAWGNGGQFIFVIPADDLVVVHLARGRSVSLARMLDLLAGIVRARPGAG